MNGLIAKAVQIAQDNSHSILTGVGVAGTISTAVLTAHATFKAAEDIAELDKELKKFLDREGLSSRQNPLSFKTKIKATWKHYIPPAAVGTITITAIILANRVAGKEAAALAAAYAVSEKAFTEYREAVVEKMGTVKEREIHDQFAEARMKNTPSNSREIILAGSGDVLCFDILSGRYFKSSRTEIEKAEIAVNHEILGFTRGASLSEFYDNVGLPPTGFSDTVGWNHDHLCRVRFSTELSVDDRPALAIDFIEYPFPNYYRIHGD
jgi:hypothetical protein